MPEILWFAPFMSPIRHAMKIVRIDHSIANRLSAKLTPAWCKSPSPYISAIASLMPRPTKADANSRRSPISTAGRETT